MSKTLKGTETFKNLIASYYSECHAVSLYSWYAKKFLRFLKAEAPPVCAEIPGAIPPMGSTLQNLQFSACGETEEGIKSYSSYADTAEKEGFAEVATIFRGICQAEAFHGERFKFYADLLEKDSLFKRDREVRWRCRNCGYVCIAKEAPAECPACGHPIGYFEVATLE